MRFARSTSCAAVKQLEAVDLPEEELERVRGDRGKGVVGVGDLLGDLATAVVA